MISHELRATVRDVTLAGALSAASSLGGVLLAVAYVALKYALRGAGFLVFCWTVIALSWAILTTDAEAHDAMPTAAQPNGWAYPFSCCSGIDCREVSSGPDGVVRETPEGYVIASTGEVVAYTDKRIKDSPDGAFHWCSVAGKDDSRTICLFVPPRAY